MTRRRLNVMLMAAIWVLAGFIGWYAERAVRVIRPWPAEAVPPSHLQRCYCRECQARRAAEEEKIAERLRAESSAPARVEEGKR